MMRIGAVLALTVLVVLLMLQIRVFYRERAALENDLAQISTELAAREEEYEALQADYEYYKNPENLEKELRARFNYRLPDETLVVIVSKASSSSSSSR